MISRVRRTLREAAWHPSDEQLVAFVDAELTGRDAVRVRDHVARCWSCKGRQRELEATIGAFVEAYTDAIREADEDETPDDIDHAAHVDRIGGTVSPRLPAAILHALRQPAARQTAPFDASLAVSLAHLGPALLRAAHAGGRAIARVGRVALAMLPSPVVLARLGAVCATAVLVVLLSSNTLLSARQLVKRVDRVERTFLSTTRAPVVYQRLAVTRRRLPAGPAVEGTWEVWTEVDQRRHRSLRQADGRGRAATAHVSPDASSRRAPQSRRMETRLEATSVETAAGADHHTSDRWPIPGSSRTAAESPASLGPLAAREAAATSAPEDDLLRSLFAVLEEHHMSGGWPVSLRAHQDWRAREAAAEDRVTSGETATGEPALVLETTTRASDLDTRGPDPQRPGAEERHAEIVSAALVVRERDWHPVEQRLVVREGDATSEFVIREIGFEVMSLASLPVAFFDDGSNAAPHTPAPAPPPTLAAATPHRPDAVDLVTAEVEAMYALYRFGVTAEDEITVQRHPTLIEVSGLTSTDERRRRLVGALDKIPLVRARIRTAEEAFAAMDEKPAAPARLARAGVAPRPAAPAASMRFDEAQIQADRLPVQALAETSTRGAPTSPASSDPSSRSSDTAPGSAVNERRAAGRADEATLRRAREAVSQSLALLERAWALRRLADWSRRTNANDVTAGTRELIDLMAQEHTEAASKALAALDTTVTSALPSTADLGRGDASEVGARPGIGADDEPVWSLDPARRSWPEMATDFFGVAAEIDRGTRRLFTASASPLTETAEEARRLRRRLDDAARWLNALHQTRP